jgi:hypothetical protein
LSLVHGEGIKYLKNLIYLLSLQFRKLFPKFNYFYIIKGTDSVAQEIHFEFLKLAAIIISKFWQQIDK